MEFSRPDHWNGQAFPSPGDLPNTGIKPRSPTLQATKEAQEYWSGWPIPSPTDLPVAGIELGSPTLQADSLATELSGKCGPQKITIQNDTCTLIFRAALFQQARHGIHQKVQWKKSEDKAVHLQLKHHSTVKQSETGVLSAAWCTKKPSPQMRELRHRKNKYHEISLTGVVYKFIQMTKVQNRLHSL